MTSETPLQQSLVPDLCNTNAVLRILLVGQMLAGILVLADSDDPYVLGSRLLLVSLYVHWLSLSCAAVLCPLRPVLRRLPLRHAVLIVLLCVQLVALLVSEVAWQSRIWMEQAAAGPGMEHSLFLARTQIISVLAWIMLLRYFYLQQQWQMQVETSARAQLQALQARIRPHFLFNALNSLAALIHDRPDDAETLVENLSELLRAALEHSDGQHALSEEVALARAYLDIEQLRLGERLTVDWDMQAATPDVKVPVLSLQPLVENAVGHGIERRAEGGTISVQFQRDSDGFQLCVTSPLAHPQSEGGEGAGRHIAQENIRHRLQLMYGDQAGLRVSQHLGHYQACLRLPNPASSGHEGGA